MKKIGVITFYYGSCNYGGVLQAYALCRQLELLGYDSEQISFKYKPSYFNLKIVLNKINKKGFDFIVKKIQKIGTRTDTFKIRNEKFLLFRESIKHSKVYTKKDLKYCNQNYDIFICGSDQIWNPDYRESNYYLKFADEGKLKISYAASISQTYLSKYDKNFMKPLLKRIDFISVRENDAKTMIEKFCNKNVKVVLDPVLLLERNEWEKIETNYKIKDKYVLVYLLADNETYLNKIRQCFKKLNYKIVIISLNDLKSNFTYKQLYDVGPKDFLSLIKSAEMLITDSFHGCVFSIIYHKKFWALKRHKDSEKENMNSRLYTLFGNLGLEDRFLDDDQNLTKEELLKKIDYKTVDKKLEILKKDSLKFLESALSESDKMIEKNQKEKETKVFEN